jgi:hypothetical protein
MGPYEFQQLRQAGAFEPPGPDAPTDLLDLLLGEFLNSPAGEFFIGDSADLAARALVVDHFIDFFQFARGYLQANRVVGQGMLSGGPTLLFEDGTAIPLVAAAAGAEPARPEASYPVTRPRDGRMRDTSDRRPDSTIAVTGRGGGVDRRPGDR